ncbi:uncharacterized protein prd1 isoform X2 [Palaemon carinicauda]|uniref:uncharacterized protein prd1 isoform X2 n=1 Tax=Palaemon carinicauda TaxID=392227 RepID=UPI0035B5BCA1
MAALKGGVKDRIIHEIGRAIKQAQIEWCGVGCVRACTGRWLVLSLDAALLHGLHSLNRGYWAAVSSLLDKPSLSMLNNLPYATKPIAKGRSWLCLCLSEGQLEGYLHALTSHRGLLDTYYGPHALLRDPHRTHILLMLVAGLEHLKMAIPMDIPGWIQSGGSFGSTSSTSMNSMNVSMTSMDSSLPSPSQHEPFDVDLSCSEALEESWHSIEGELPVSHSKCEDIDSQIEIEHISKSTRRKRQSRSSSQSSSRVTSGGTTPTEHGPTVKKNSFQLSIDKPKSQRTVCEILENIPFDCRTDVSQNGEVPKSGCDNFDKNVNKSQKTIEENLKFKEKLLKEVDKETKKYANLVDKIGSSSNLNKSDLVEKADEGSVQKETDVVVRRTNLPSAKNIDKRVSFTESTEAGPLQKSMHNRLSLCVDLKQGAEIRDLSDLRDLLSNLKCQGLLPSTLALEELFTTLDQASPALSERAPPEGQEDPPLHQSIISLTHNNNDVDDDNKNNNDSDTGSTLVSDTSSTPKDTDDKRRLDIIGGVRWEELTKIGCEIIGEGGVDEEELQREVSMTGARPKQRLGCEFTKSEPVVHKVVNNSVAATSRFRERLQKKKAINNSERRRLYKESFRKERKLPSLYIPVDVDISKYKEEEDRLNLEIVQGQSNLVMTGQNVDLASQEVMKNQLFTKEDEKFYRLFSVREGHSSGSSVGVQIVLSSQALYVLNPLPKWTKPRHHVPYHDIHTIIVGSNDQWVCVLNKKALLDDLATTGANSGVQLEIGDPDITHSLISSLEVAIRRHFSALKLSRDEKPVKQSLPELKLMPQPRRKSFQLSRECADNFSNSLLEKSQVNLWPSKKDSFDVSMASSDISQQDSPALTPGSLNLSQDSPDISEVSLPSETSNEMSETSTESSQNPSDISQVDTDNSQASTDVSQDLSELSQASSVSHSSDGTASSGTLSSPVEVNGNPALELIQDDSTAGQEEKPEDVCPVKLHLEKQYGLLKYAGGYSRWNGTVLDRSLPAVIVHPAWELSGLRKWLRAQLRLQDEPEVVGCWLADWEDGSSLGGGEASGPLGPANEGPLMFRPPGLLSSWKPAYFILKAGVLYQFHDALERLPHMIIEVVQCIGCVRIATSQRPHAFQLLRKNAPPIMLAASDEHGASLWLQAFLTIINSGVRDVSERGQVSCRVVLLESGVLLAQQSDMILGAPPSLPISAVDDVPSDRKNSSAAETSQQVLSSSPNTNLPCQWDKKDLQKPLNPTLSNLRDRKPLSSSLTNLHRVNSASNIPCSPTRRISTGERTSTPIGNQSQNRKGSLSRLSDFGSPDIKIEIREKSALHIKKDKRPKLAKSERVLLGEGFKPKGELKVLTYSALEQISSVSVYAECPSTCLVEFECSEAGEISGDWALYFRSGGQLQSFITTLARTWNSISQEEFPLHTVDDPGVQQFLLEGSQIASNGWSPHP